MKKYLFISILFVFLTVIIGLEFASKHVIPYALIQPYRITEDINPGDFGLVAENLSIKTADSIELDGYWVHTSNVPKAIIIFVHGIGGCKEHFFGLSKQMDNQGYESILFDLRAHGKSEGQFTTYGFKEKNDIDIIIDRIRLQNDSIKIGIWGNSLGGAIALQSMEQENEITFGVIESTFRDLEEIMIDYQRRLINLPLGYYMQKSMREAEKLADFKIKDVKPIQSVRKIDRPVLIAHGDSDENISFQYGKDLYNNLLTRDKKWVLVEGGGHFGLNETGGNKYFHQILEFITNQVESEN
ncbi:MAG: alpha/beta fold hydrolase [Cytophagales bacterium]|nr:alpha/beta fold hydrolase [Cytophagales bacterium]